MGAQGRPRGKAKLISQKQTKEEKISSQAENGALKTVGRWERGVGRHADRGN